MTRHIMIADIGGGLLAMAAVAMMRRGTPVRRVEAASEPAPTVAAPMTRQLRRQAERKAARKRS